VWQFCDMDGNIVEEKPDEDVDDVSNRLEQEIEDRVRTEENTPQEDDYVIADASGGGYDVSRHNTKFLGHANDWDEAVAIIRNDSKGTWTPTVWTVNDHGNIDRVTDFQY